MEGLDLLSLFPCDSRAVVERVLSGMAEGLVQSCQCRALVELPDGRSLEFSAWIRALSGSPEGRVLLAAVPGGVPAPAAGPPLPTPMVGPMASLDAARLTLATVDHDWRFVEMSPDAEEWLGWVPEECRGRSLQSVVHPEDVPLLLLALGRSSVDHRSVATGLRVRSCGGEWTPVRCEVSPLCEHSPSRFAVALWCLDGRPDESSDQRAARLEEHLWRIALEVAAVDIGEAPATTEMWWGDPALRELSQRQLEILRRLLRGERVPTIARDLYLSQSTARNHLSAIYRRLGVHSQAELLARLLPTRQAPSDAGV